MNINEKIEMIFKFMGEATRDEVGHYLLNSKNKNYFKIQNQSMVGNVFGKQLEEFLYGLNNKQLETLRSYTGYNYRFINAILRDKWTYDLNGELTKEKSDYYKSLSLEIEKIIRLFPPVNIDFKVYRGTPLSYFKDYGINGIEDLNLLVGKYIYEEGFTSTSVLEENSFFKKENELGINYNVNIIYNIDGSYNDGAFVSHDYLTYSPNQSEYIINKSSLFKVDDVKIDKENRTATIEATLIPSKIWDVNRFINEKNRLK